MAVRDISQESVCDYRLEALVNLFDRLGLPSTEYKRFYYKERWNY